MQSAANRLRVHRRPSRAGIGSPASSTIEYRERVEDAFSEEHPAPPDLKEKLAHARRQSQTP
jgi:hypothetical protein